MRCCHSWGDWLKSGFPLPLQDLIWSIIHFGIKAGGYILISFARDFYRLFHFFFDPLATAHHRLHSIPPSPPPHSTSISIVIWDTVTAVPLSPYHRQRRSSFTGNNREQQGAGSSSAFFNAAGYSGKSTNPLSILAIFSIFIFYSLFIIF